MLIKFERLKILLDNTKNMYFFTKSFERQIHNLCLIILHYKKARRTSYILKHSNFIRIKNCKFYRI